jgi:hypothetical protein
MTSQSEAHCVNQIPLPLGASLLVLGKVKTSLVTKKNGSTGSSTQSRKLYQIDGRTASQRVNDLATRHFVGAEIETEFIAEAA